MKGDRLGSIPCPCCGSAWTASESKTGGISLICSKGFMGWAKYPAPVAGIRARLSPAGPAPAIESKPASKPEPDKPAAKKGAGFSDWLSGKG